MLKNQKDLSFSKRILLYQKEKKEVQGTLNTTV